ncbi:MAG: peptidyl-prolyl cis-trans isomerase [Spirochaetes bacterium]|nr:MAG: peptidyl-prolyl cis-trans isomerase [Spirochaetota bacterium]
MKRIFILVVILVAMVGCKSEPVAPKPLDFTDSVEIETDAGTMVVGLYGNAMPKTVKNFLQYVDTKFYDGTIFHRVIAGFVAQGGGFTKENVEKPTKPPVALEMSPAKPQGKDQQSAPKIPLLTNSKNTIAMARQRAPHTATSQFYFNLKDNPHLNSDITKSEPNGYAVFGVITKGAEVLSKIVEMNGNGKKVLIKSIKRVKPMKKGDK